MRRILTATLSAALLLGIAGSASAAGKLTTTISGPVAGSFAITVSGGKANDAYSIWVAQKCYASGVVVSAVYLPVVWDQQTTFPSTGSAGPFAANGTTCTAYTWKYPASQTPLASVTF